MSNLLVQQLPALLGLGVGALATYGATAFGERARWKRDRLFRWDNERLRVYTDYGDAVKKVFHISARLAAARGFPHLAEPLEPTQAAIDVLSEAKTDRSRAWEAVLLLGDPATVAAARAWHEAAWRVSWYARGRFADPDQWEPTVTDSARAREAFYERARRDLGVGGGAVPTPPWPSEWIPNLKTVTDIRTFPFDGTRHGVQHPSPNPEPGSVRPNIDTRSSLI